MDRAVIAGEALQPDLLHGEDSTGASQVVSRWNRMSSTVRGAAPQAVRRVAVERVLADVEIEGRQVPVAKLNSAWNTPWKS
jgi:hypothetical protein